MEDGFSYKVKQYLEQAGIDTKQRQVTDGNIPGSTQESYTMQDYLDFLNTMAYGGIPEWAERPKKIYIEQKEYNKLLEVEGNYQKLLYRNERLKENCYRLKEDLLRYYTLESDLGKIRAAIGYERYNEIVDRED